MHITDSCNPRCFILHKSSVLCIAPDCLVTNDTICFSDGCKVSHLPVSSSRFLQWIYQKSVIFGTTLDWVMKGCYGTFCRPCTICQRQIVPTLAAHFVVPMHNLTPGDKMCKSAYFVVPHRMDLNIHSDIYLLNMKEAIYYILWYVYIIFITYLHLH